MLDPTPIEIKLANCLGLKNRGFKKKIQVIGPYDSRMRNTPYTMFSILLSDFSKNLMLIRRI